MLSPRLEHHGPTHRNANQQNAHDNDNMTDTTSTDVITFQTPMTLQADAEVRLACDGEIQVRSRRCSILVSAQTPITLSVSTKSDVTPFDNLNEDFARGWRKLPDELRIEILSYNLVAANVISSNKSNDCDSNFTLGRELRHHLTLGLDIAPLAWQIF